MNASSETKFANLFSLLSQAQLLTGTPPVPSGTPAFVTTGRVLPPPANVSAIMQPAMYLITGEEEIIERVQGAAHYEQTCAAIILFNNSAGPNAVAATQLNNLRDAFIYQLQQRTLASDGMTVIPLFGGQKQTLGGVVYHARAKGRVIKVEGLTNGQGAIVFMISLLDGM